MLSHLVPIDRRMPPAELFMVQANQKQPTLSSSSMCRHGVGRGVMFSTSQGHHCDCMEVWQSTFIVVLGGN